MSTQALNSQSVQTGMKDILLNHAGLYESLRSSAQS
jgi:type I restriction enzyme, R subunit